MNSLATLRLSVDNITVYMDKQIICHHLSLQLHAGMIWGVLGANGSGKTTLLHALAGLHPLAQGHIFLQHQTLTSLPRKQIARSIGMLFQDTPFNFPQTVYDYCAAARFAHANQFHALTLHDKRCVDEALQVMSLQSMQHQFITALSGGEKRRVAIASVLAQTPTIYLLDEPTNHLDIRYQANLLAHLKKLSTRHCVVMSLHDPNLVQQYCDHVLMILPDQSVLCGKTNELLTTENLSRLYGVKLERHCKQWGLLINT